MATKVQDPPQNFGVDDLYTDYKGRKTDPTKHGGKKAATIACFVEMMQSLVYWSNGVTLVDYFLKSMHYSVSESSNMVTNFMGAASLLSIIWGFVSDAYITRFTTFMFSGSLELMGFIILTYQAYDPHLQPPANRKPSPIQVAVLYTGLYAIATGIAGIKATLPAHGADQLDPTNKIQISSYFSWYFSCISFGSLMASTVMVWVGQSHGWTVSFTISAVIWGIAQCTFAAGFPLYRHKRPSGSSISRLIKVCVAAAQNSKAPITVGSSDHSVTEELLEVEREQSNDKFKFLNQALNDPNIGMAEVKETKSFLGLLPIFATTIMVNCTVAQLLTFSVQQGSFMNTKVHNFTIPTQYLVVFPIFMILTFIFLLEHFKHARRNQAGATNNKIYQPLTRIGIGLALASVSMGVAAIVESKRLSLVATNDGHQMMSVFWLLFQYIFCGMAEALAQGGMMEFFYTEAPDSMRSICTSLSGLSSSMGFFISSMLVAISNSISEKFGREWFGGNDLNHSRLDLFYALLCNLNIINFLLYVYFAKRY